MEKLLTPLTVALLAAVLGKMIYNRFFYAGQRRRIPGQHRYAEADCVTMMAATVIPTTGERHTVLIYGFKPLALGVL